MLRAINQKILRNLREDLESTFHVIAHAGYSSNSEWIRQRQAELKEEYGFSTPEFRGAKVALPIRRNRRCSVIESEEIAYSIFMTIDPGDSPESIAQTCEEALQDYILN